MHRQNWYTECCHGCKQYKSHGDWNGSGKFHGSFTSRSLLFSILFKASYMKRTRRVSFYPICEASGCLTFNKKDTNIGKCGAKTHGWHDSVNGTDFNCFLSRITQLQTTNSAKSFWEDWTVARNFGNKNSQRRMNFCSINSEWHECPWGISHQKFEPVKTVCASKIHRNIVKFFSGQEFLEKLGILANFVNKFLHYFWTIL